MFGIGDFARHGRVSVRMLRHYDSLGLLRPARVEEASGYRYYHAAQLARLNRIIALKDLGFTLEQVRTILDEKLDVGELHGMLRLRRAQLEAAVSADLDRLARVEARLSLIESEGLMPADEIVVKTVPAVRVAELSAVAASYQPEDIGPVIGPLFGELCRRLDAAGITPAGPGIACYEQVQDGVLVRTCLPVAGEVPAGSGLTASVLPEIEAATTIYRGSLSQADPVVQRLASWIEAHGFQGVGYAREVSLECPANEDDWVTEFQEPVTRIA